MQLQEEKDATNWGVDLVELEQAMAARGVVFVRAAAVDFDTASLARGLPRAVVAIAQQLAHGRKTYVHCTAGVHRSPTAIIAYLHWIQGQPLSVAHKFVTSRRSCSPYVDAISIATQSLLSEDDAPAAAPATGFARLARFFTGTRRQQAEAPDELTSEQLQHVRSSLAGKEELQQQPCLF